MFALLPFFFQTNSSIAEEPSRNDFTPPQSSSPPKEAKKEGHLSCKSAIIDGKVSRDSVTYIFFIDTKDDWCYCCHVMLLCDQWM